MLKKLSIAAAAALVVAGATACSSGTTPAATGTTGGSATKADSGSKTIYLVSKGFQHQFWQAVKKGAEDAGKDLGYEVKFVGPDKETEIDKQLDMLKTALTAKPAAIGLAALDSGAAASILKDIKAANIPVVAFDSGVDSDIPLTTVQTDNKAAAAEAAKRLSGLIGGEGTVGLVCHDQVSQTGIQRCTGFQDWMKANAPKVKVITPQYAGDVAKAADAAKAIMQANPDIKAMYGTNEAAAIGVVQGVKEANMAGKVQIVGFDSGKAQLDAIKAGTEAGAITQSPVKMGYNTVKAAVDAIKGQTLPKVLDSGFAWYDKTNIDSADIKANLYE